jgi:SAM-dependent methyltransferase
VTSEQNRAFWDERVPIHTAGDFYDVEGFKAGREPLEAFELEDLGDVSGRSLVHLQCHFGLDTLSWARHGARVTGLDFSPPAIEAARRLAADIGVEADFVCANVYDAPEALGDRRFDVVYVNVGAINWLPDIRRWAEVVGILLTPGGVLYMKEVHPFSWVFGDDDLTVENDYFAHRSDYDDPGTYTDPDAATFHNRTEEWQHPLGVPTVAARSRFLLNMRLLLPPRVRGRPRCERSGLAVRWRPCPSRTPRARPSSSGGPSSGSAPRGGPRPSRRRAPTS